MEFGKRRTLSAVLRVLIGVSVSKVCDEYVTRFTLPPV